MNTEEVEPTTQDTRSANGSSGGWYEDASHGLSESQRIRIGGELDQYRTLERFLGRNRRNSVFDPGEALPITNAPFQPIS